MKGRASLWGPEGRHEHVDVAADDAAHDHDEVPSAVVWVLAVDDQALLAAELISILVPALAKAAAAAEATSLLVHLATGRPTGEAALGSLS